MDNGTSIMRNIQLQVSEGVIVKVTSIPTEGEKWYEIHISLHNVTLLILNTGEELIRKGVADYKENFKGKELTESEWVDAMVKFPKLIERPIVVKGDKAVIGRPIEKVIQLLSEGS